MAENLDPEIIAKITEAYRNHYESLRENNLISEAQNKAEKAKKDLYDKSAKAFTTSINAVESFTKSLISNESSFKQAAGVASTAADLASEIAKQFGTLGGLASVAIQAASKLVQAAAAQADAVTKAKDQVTKYGAAADLSSNQLLGLAHAAGYYSLNMNKLYTAAGKAGGDLLLFSKNMSGGVETFAKMAAVGDSTLSTFNSLGVPKEELAEYMADYVKYLGSTNIQLNASQKTQAALQKGSLEYTKNVLELSALTGKDVDTVKKKQQEAQASIDIQIHYSKLQAQAAERRAAGDEKGAQELERQIEREKAIIDKTSLTFDAATTAAVRNALATGGSFTEISANLAAAGVDIGKLVRLAKDDSLTIGQASAAATEEITSGVKRAIGNFGESIIYTGDSLGKQVAVSLENNGALARGAGEAVENQKKVFEELNKAQADGFKSMQNMIDAAVRSFQIQADAILLSLSPFSNDLATIMENAKKLMKEILKETWDFLKKEVLEPANKYIKDRFGVDIIEITKTVVTKLGELATGAENLWKKFSSLTSITDKILVGLGAIIGAIAGFALGGLPGAAVGAVAGGALATYMLPEDKPKVPKPTTSEVSSAWGTVGIPGHSGKQGQGTTSATPTSSGAAKTSTGSLKGDTSGLDSELQKRLMAASEVYGKPLTITSGFRTSDKQKELYEAYKSGRSKFPAAPPGSSKHERGMAVDIGEYQDPAAVRALASQGLMQTVSGDPVHFEVPGPKTAAASGSSSASGTSVQSSSSTTTGMSSSDDTLIRVMIDMRNSINSKMQEMVDKVAESNGILEKIMRHAR